MRPHLAFGLLLFAGCLLLLAGCHRGQQPSPAGRKSALPDGGLAAFTSEADDEPHSVYPIEKGPPAPLAQRLCDAFHTLPEKRRSECCAAPTGIVLTSECARMLSSALRAKALAVAPADADACVAAMQQSLTGCEWVGPFPSDLPDACLGLFRGLVPSGARCRSSVECAGSLYCHGVGPTSGGVCGPAGEDGTACNLAVDALAGYLRQGDVDVRHPECAGRCDHHRCMPITAAGAACGGRLECGAGHHCAGGRCVAGAFGKLGEACTAGGCGPGLRCFDEVCIAPRAEGAACTSFFQCRGGLCATPDGGTQGTCQHDCLHR